MSPGPQLPPVRSVMESCESTGPPSLAQRRACGVRSSFIRGLFLGLVGMFLVKYLCVLKM